MVTAVDVLRMLAAKDVQFSFVDGVLRSSGPVGAITPELATLVKAYKPQIEAHVQQQVSIRSRPFGRAWLGHGLLELDRLYSVRTVSGYVAFIRRDEDWFAWRHDDGIGEGPWRDLAALLDQL